MESRPKLKIELAASDRLVEWMAWLLLIGLWIFALVNYSDLPDQVPMHFNARGEVDRYGDKASSLILPLIATLLFFGMTWLNRYPHVFNYLEPITASNAERQYTMATRLIRSLKLAVVAIFFIILVAVQQAATENIAGLGPWLLSVILVITFLPLIVYLFKVFIKP